MCAKTITHTQLALSLEPTNESSFEHFCWGDHHLLKQQLLSLESLPSETAFFYLWGSEGVGKSHLLQAACMGYSQQSAVYLPLKTLLSWGPEILIGQEHQSLITIDDIDAIAGHAPFEEALFHLINTVKQSPEKKVILASRFPPNASPIILPDLRSRLHWGLSYHLSPLNDLQKIETMQHYAHKRGFALPTHVAKYLIEHFNRNMHNLIDLLRTLDKASLAAQRKITLPFVKQILSRL